MQFGGTRIQWVVFDAVGTLIEPRPRVADVYHAACLRHGGTRSPDEIARRFREVMAARIADPRTSEQDEREFWQRTVADVLGTVKNPEACFAELYEHFATPEAWKLCQGVEQTLARLSKHDVRVAVASNFDQRLHRVLDGLSGMDAIQLRVISSEVGWRKPDHRFFEALLAQTGVSSKEILIVGDDVSNDIVPARELGMTSVFVRGRGSETNVEAELTVASVDEILNWCQFDE